MNVRIRTTTMALIVAAVAAGSLGGCAHLQNRERGALIGAGAGAALGGVIGNATGSTARGAIIGAAVGGAAGAIIGHQMDQQAKELHANIPGATVTRVGEGIAVSFESGLLYPFDSSTLLPAAQQNLANLAESLRKYPESNITIVGHTDSQGSDSYNQALSERRAIAAADYLAAQGVPRSRITTYGRGKSEPIATNETEVGRQENRRVEVAIYASPEYRDRLLRSQGQ